MNKSTSMKTVLVCLFLVPTLAFAQRRGAAFAQPNTWGYVGGVRLDSIPAIYAQAAEAGASNTSFGVLKEYNFEYGQLGKKISEMALTNDKGETLLSTSAAGAMNFFEFNG